MRKVISRYGTLPKTARVSAFLDSLHQNLVTGAGEAPAEFISLAAAVTKKPVLMEAKLKKVNLSRKSCALIFSFNTSFPLL